MGALVSVIIPYFNRLEALEIAVQSVINQAYRPLELILINDGGLEFELPIESGKEISVKLISLDTNLGPASARNAGIEVARGEFVAFLDSDDVWTESKLASQIHEMVHHDLGFTHTSYVRRDIQTGVEEVIRSGAIDYGFLLTAFRCRIATPTVVVRRDVIGNNLFDTSTRVGEDILFWLGCFEKNGPSVGLDEASCIVNVSGESHFQSEKNKARSLEVINIFLKKNHPYVRIIHSVYVFFRKMMVKFI
jgi:glycosyltransferase involved in cell wall biosynthesis